MPTYDCHLRAWRQHRDELKRFLAHRSGNAAEADDLAEFVLFLCSPAGAGMTGRFSVRCRIISNDAEPDPITTPAW